MGKHTPGPWKTITGSAVHAADGRWIATVHPMDVPSERMANNRLIAAAPEMLEALEDIIAAIEMEEDFEGVVDASRAAIAKARGEVE